MSTMNGPEDEEVEEDVQGDEDTFDLDEIGDDDFRDCLEDDDFNG